jgi:hypothetical protein
VDDGARQVGGQPLTVCERDHQVLAALPEVGGDRDRVEVEAPRAGERQVVVEPTVDADRHRLAELAGQEVAELAGERLPVDRRKQCLYLGLHLVAGDPQQFRTSGLEVRAELRLPREGGTELVVVLLAHPVEKGQSFGVVRCDARDAQHSADAVGGERTAGEGMRTTTRPAGHGAGVLADVVEHGQGIGDLVGDRAAGTTRGGAVPRARPGHESMSAFVHLIGHPAELHGSTRSAVVEQEHPAAIRAGDLDLECAAVGEGDRGHGAPRGQKSRRPRRESPRSGWSRW